MAVQVPQFLWHDAMEHLRGFIHGAADVYNDNDLFSASRLALRELVMACPWNYYWTEGEVALEAAFDTGTLTYDHTGGANERMFTISSGTLPTNLVYFKLRVDGVDYKVAERKSATIGTLTTDSNPGADVAAGTSYTLFRSEYALPSDWRKIQTPLPKDWGGLRYVEPDEFYTYERQVRGTGNPWIYTIVGASNPAPDDAATVPLRGQLAVRVYPGPSAAKTLPFPYYRWPRQLKISGEATADTVGTVTTDGTTTIVGTSTTFTAAQVGSIIRVGSDGTNIPTSFDGRYPPVAEEVITARASATSITVANTVATQTAVKYRISDPLDISEGMYNVYLRCCEKQLATRQRDFEILGVVKAAYREEMELAMANDHAFAGAATSGESYPAPLSYGVGAPIEARIGV